LAEGVLPVDWKLATVVPIFKKGSKHEASNYRPVSLTAVPCKVLESIIKDAVVCHLDQNNFPASCQHGFVKGRSTLTNLLETLESWTKILEEGLGLDIIYLDYRKAFDTVSHHKLLTKLAKFRAGKQTVKVDRTFSDWQTNEGTCKWKSLQLDSCTEWGPTRICVGTTTFPDFCE